MLFGYLGYNVSMVETDCHDFGPLNLVGQAVDGHCELRVTGYSHPQLTFKMRNRKIRLDYC